MRHVIALLFALASFSVLAQEAAPEAEPDPFVTALTAARAQDLDALKGVITDERWKPAQRHRALLAAMLEHKAPEDRLAFYEAEYATTGAAADTYYRVWRARLAVQARDWATAATAATGVLAETARADWRKSMHQVLVRAAQAEGDAAAAIEHATAGLCTCRKFVTLADAQQFWTAIEEFAPEELTLPAYYNLTRQILAAYPPPNEPVEDWARFLSRLEYRLETLQ